MTVTAKDSVAFMNNLKLILIVALFLSACSKSVPNRVSAPANTATPTPESGIEAILQDETDRVATLAGLGKMGSSLGKDDVEVRVWFGFGLFPLEGFVMSRRDSRWSAFHLKADRHYQPTKASRNELQPPRSGWEVCWQQLVNAGVLTLPNGTDGPDPDAQGYLVQVRSAASSRSYHYVAPEHSDLPAAKNMLEIGDIISNEFGLLRFRARKSNSS